MRRARLAEASVCRGRGVAAAAQGARQGRERRVEKAHASCAVAALRIGQQPATARLLPVSSLSLSILSLFLFLSSIQSIGSQPCLSVPRELPPHSASRESSSDQPRYFSALFRQKSLSLVQNCIVRQIGSIVFFFPLYIHNQSNRLQKRYFSRIFIRSFRSIILRFTCRRVEKCVSSHEHLFFSRIRGEREREKERKRSARDLECCAKMDFHEGMDIQGWDKGSPIPLKPEPADLRNGTEVSLVL